MEKNYEVYTAFEPWMIGQTVEIGVYEKDDNGETGNHIYSHAGTLHLYLIQLTGVSYLLNGMHGSITVVPENAFLISVIEPFRS
jgi:hypothetical protein